MSEARGMKPLTIPEQAEMFRALYEKAPFLIGGFDVNRRCILWNRECERVFGYSYEELLAMKEPLSVFYPNPDDLRDVMDSATDQANGVFREWHPITRDGQRLTTRWAGFRLSNGTTISIGYDITDLLQAKKRLTESEGKYRLLTEGMKDVVWVLDTETMQFTYISPSIQGLRGYTPEEIMKDPIDAVFMPGQAEKYRNLIRERVEEHASSAQDSAIRFYTDEVEQTCKDGSSVLTEIISRYKTNENNGHVELHGVSRDISERKRIEAEIRERQLLLDRIFDVLPIGLWFADKTGTLIRGNPEGIRIWGAEPKVPIQKYGVFKARRLPSGQEIAPADWALARTIRDGTETAEERLEIDAFDGKKRIVLNYTYPVRDDAGNLLGAIVMNNDVTAQHHAEEERERLRSHLQQMEKMESIGRLAGGVAHDFNNMLGVIMAYAERGLSKTAPGDPLHHLFDSIRSASQRSADITKQLLAFARKQPASPIVVDLNGIVEQGMKMVRRLIGENIGLVWEPSANIALVKVAPTQIDQILINLCTNARDAIRENGTIRVSTGPFALHPETPVADPEAVPGDYVRLTVEDNGCGMDQSTLNKLFEPFFTTKEFGRGTGLGLPMVHGIIKQNHGFIEVESKIGEGTRFNLYFPQVKNASTSEPVPEPATTPPGDVGKILLVEDEPDLCEALQLLIEEDTGFTVRSASDTSDAIRIVEEDRYRPDLLVTDVVMPGMNGKQLSNRLRKTVPGLKVLFMSGYASDVILDAGTVGSAIRLIEKPFTAKQLVTAIRDATRTVSP